MAEAGTTNAMVKPQIASTNFRHFITLQEARDRARYVPGLAPQAWPEPLSLRMALVEVSDLPRLGSTPATLAAVWRSGLPLHRCSPVGDDDALLWKRAIRARTMGEAFQRPDVLVATLPPASISVCDNDHRRIPAFADNILSNLICWRSQSPQGRPEAVRLLIRQGVLAEWQHHADWDDAVYRVAAIIPMNSLQLDQEAFVQHLQYKAAA